jgi:hypothetical protein
MLSSDFRKDRNKKRPSGRFLFLEGFYVKVSLALLPFQEVHYEAEQGIGTNIQPAMLARASKDLSNPSLHVN